MKKQRIGFTGEEYKEPAIGDFLGEWILFSLRGNGFYAGKLISLGEREASFHPYQKVTYGKNGRPKYVIMYEGMPSSYLINDIVGRRETSEQEVLNFCKNMNRIAQIEWLEQELKISALEKQLYPKKEKNSIN